MDKIIDIDNELLGVTAQQMFEVTKQGIVNGKLESLKVLHYLKKFSDAFDLLKKDNDILLVAGAEIERYGKSCKVFGREFRLQSVVVYDFKGSNDPYLLKLESEIKKRKELLRNIDKSFFDENSEGLEVLPLKKRLVTYIVMQDL